LGVSGHDHVYVYDHDLLVMGCGRSPLCALCGSSGSDQQLRWPDPDPSGG
jgi:hypothetical protein